MIAVALSGGGERVVAWQVGVLAGLADSGLDLRWASAVLGKNYPGTYWYRQSLRLLLKEQKQTGLWTAGSATKKK